ncbi:hypothetical protein [Sorangium sp. So ce1000]|uniref:hypothetical protein n=1 Tax=Sorangium sp. So ce1000 TaxID=3133325 RepID=UPI003F5F02A1
MTITERAPIWLGFAAAIALSAARAPAMEAGAPEARQSPGAPLVEIVLTGPASSLGPIRTALASQALSAFTLRFRVAPAFDAAVLFAARSSSGVALSCWIDVSDPRRAALYFTDPVADRFLVRSIELSGGFDELDRESVAQVVELSLRSLRGGARASLDREQARALVLRQAAPSAGAPGQAAPSAGAPGQAAPSGGAPRRALPVGAPASASVPAPRRALELGAFYGITAHSDEVGWTHGPGVRIALGGGSGRQRLALDARLQYQLERRYEEPRIGLDLRTIALRADASWLYALTPSAAPIELGARLGAGLDHVYAAPRPGSAGAPSFVPAGASASNALVLVAGAVAKLPLSRDVRLFTELFVELDPARVRYELALEQGTETVLARYRFRPGVLLGIEL